MIEIKLHGTYNIYYAILGMRNPMNSWHLMDSSEPDQAGNCKLGEKDLNLAQRLTLAGTEHGKFLRFITVCFDLTAPLYWWKEFDTYKFAEKNSCSTMHKLTSRDLAPHDFSFDKLTDYRNAQIRHLNDLIKAYKSREGDSEEDNAYRKADLQGTYPGPSERLHAETDSHNQLRRTPEYLLPAPPSQA